MVGVSLLPLIFSLWHTVEFFHNYWCSVLQRSCSDLASNCSLYNICKLILTVILTILLPPLFMLFWAALFMCPSFYIHSMFLYMTIKKWSLCSDDTKTNAYNAKLFEYITRDNKYYINNFKQTQQKIIAVNYYILSVIKEKINDYPEEQQDKDNRFLQKVSLLHDQSRLSYKNNKGQYLWSVNWSYFRKEGRSNRMCAIFIWFLFFSLYSSAIGLIVYSYYYDGITLPLTLFLLLEMVNIIFIIIHRRILVLSCRLLPNINYPYNSKVEMLWNALDISYISQNEMIRRIRI